MTPFVFALCFASLGASELTVESVPAGAAVRVDDLPPGIAPFTVDLKPGSHTIQVSTDGYVTETRQVVLQDDKSESVSVILEAKPVEYYDTEGDIAFWGGLGAGAALAGFGHWGAADSADRIRNDDIDA
ncbi:MAG: PEGA domain-containing protein, partial [Myxococcota bacterium]